MQVTPRLPVHGKYAASQQFCEMRYLRFGSASRTAAVVFGFLEELLLPLHKPYRNNFAIRVTQAKLTLQSTQVLELVSDPLLRPEHCLAMWNAGAFCAAVITALLELFGLQSTHEEYLLLLLAKEYTLNIVKFDTFPTVSTDLRIYADFGSDFAVLLYRNWTMDSFLVTHCGHIHLKAHLFARARERMRKPMQIDEFQAAKLLCLVNSCSQDISHAVFQAGRQIATFTSPLPQAYFSAVTTGLSTKKVVAMYRKEMQKHGKCASCGDNNVPFECGSGHRVCQACVVRACLVQNRLVCPSCESFVDKRHLREISGLIREKTGWERSLTLICAGCNSTFPSEYFLESTEIAHKCLFCANCFQLFRRDLQCPVCTVNCPNSPRETPQIPPKTAILPFEEAKKQTCLYCHAVKTISEYRFYLYEVHSCYICDACYRISVQQGQRSRCRGCSSFYFSASACTTIFTVTGQTGLLSVICRLCNERGSIEHFGIYQRLSHWWKCKICDMCVQRASGSSPPSACLDCKQSFTLADKGAISLRTLPKAPSNTQYEFAPCAICERIQPAFKYDLIRASGHQCLVCEDCLYASRNASTQAVSCPQCYAAFHANSQNSILQAEATNRLKPEMAVIALCSVCKREKAQFNALKCTQLYHSCVICDQCLNGIRNVLHCPACQASYESHDRGYLAKIMRMKVDTHPQTGLFGVRKCRCGQEMTEKEFKCSRKCCCFTCLLGNFLLTGRPNCPICKETVVSNYMFPKAVECSSCFQTLSTNPHSSKRVHGICPNHCLLCVFCIQIDSQGRALCRNCSVPLLTGEIGEVLARQKSFMLGCYCGELGGREEKTNCGHRAHGRCTPALYSCRICMQMLKEKPRKKTLMSYFPVFK